ncbi:hypothetical protein C3Y89_11335 [Rhizobium sp. UPM1132]|nr:hypothetical protein [Rhizobium ruizarguesonis]NKQ78674.1 hypothetical protein [Rhizobium ruizarguesonis]
MANASFSTRPGAKRIPRPARLAGHFTPVASGIHRVGVIVPVARVFLHDKQVVEHGRVRRPGTTLAEGYDQRIAEVDLLAGTARLAAEANVAILFAGRSAEPSIR